MRKILINVVNGTFILLFLCSIAGCTKKDLYNPDTDPDPGKQPLPDPSEYFDFNMRTDVNLSVDYGVPGFKALIEVYDENPLASEDNQRQKKEGVEALFKIYTDENGKFEGKMNIPTAVKSVYLYTNTWGLPGCVKLDVENGTVRYTPTSPKGRAAQQMPYPFSGEIPYTLNAGAQLYSICKWLAAGHTQVTQGYITPTTMVKEEKMNDFATRMQNFFVPNGQYQDNSIYCKGPDITNVHLIKDAQINLVFVNKDASYYNTFGYYYYKSETEKGINPPTQNKYVIFPYVENGLLTCGDKVQLKFFGEDGKNPASDTFPGGYTIGWFIYSNGFNVLDYETFGQINVSRPLITTNDQRSAYVTLADEKSGKLIIGVEDGANMSFCDMLFYTEATPEDAIRDDNKPIIPDNDKPAEPTPDATESKKGTLAFEDIWPTGGDYDMNDVVIEYERKVSFNTNNKVTKIEDIFRPVHNGATYTNAFAYQIDQKQFGTVSNLPAGTTIEKETSSIIVFTNSKAEVGKTYTITREFDGKSLSKEDIAEYNPYIIVNYVQDDKARKEVHLPKQKATSLADQSLIGDKDDAYYLKRDGKYPFAIDIPIWGFKVVTESKHIDAEYNGFAKWAESDGQTHKDWYK